MYEIIKTKKWVTDSVFWGSRHDGHAETIYLIREDGVLRDEQFSSEYEATKYIKDFLTKKDEIVCTLFKDASNTSDHNNGWIKTNIIFTGTIDSNGTFRG